MRPRYLRRKAKQTKGASSEKTTHSRSLIPISPKKTVAASPSTFSPFRKDYSTMPEHAQKTNSKSQNLTSAKRSTTALPTTLSPVAKSHHSLIPESHERMISLEVRNTVSSKRPAVVFSSGFSPSVERDYSLKQAARSPSHHPESPTIRATAPSTFQQTSDILSMQKPNLPSNNDGHTQSTPEKTRSPYHETLKRKHVAIEEDLPSSSPLGPISPKRRRPSASELPLEIASTPENNPEREIEGPFSPLFINLELEEDEPSLPEGSSENDSPGQQVSDTLSEPGRVVNNTQAIFGDATQLIDFDIHAPEGGWDEEELLFHRPSQPVSFDFPPPDDSREDDKRGTRESTQLVDFDLLPPEGGWDDEETRVKGEFDFASTENYDPQPTLPDTQAILRSKTPAPDFTIADPDGGWKSLIASSPPIIPTSPRAESVFSQTDLKDQMDAWIDAHAVNGISVEQVESVLKSTSMDTTLADKALRHLAKKGVLPKDWRCVWTESDDKDMRSTDARKIQRLQEKHGADGLAARWEFLAFYAEEES